MPESQLPYILLQNMIVNLSRDVLAFHWYEKSLKILSDNLHVIEMDFDIQYIKNNNDISNDIQKSKKMRKT